MQMDFFLQLGFLGLMLVIGIILRAKVKFLQTFMVPATILGGLIGFAIISWDGFSGERLLPFGPKAFEPIAYHAFVLCFTLLMLTPRREGSDKPSLGLGSYWFTAMQGVNMLGQTFIGAGSFYIFSRLVETDHAPALGLFNALGFSHGIGQAIAIAKLWEQTYGINVGLQLGLVFASLGFFVSLFVGVPMMRFFIKRKLNHNKDRASIEPQFLKGLMDKTTNISAGFERTHSCSIDTMTFQLFIALLVYGAAEVERSLTAPFIFSLAGHLGPIGMILKTFWAPAIVFIHCIVIAGLTRTVLTRMGLIHLICPGVQQRLSGMMVDVLMASALMAIQLGVLMQFWIPISMSLVLSTLFTLGMCYFFSKRSINYGPERFATSFGLTTGTMASGLMLLRILDPDYRTPIPLEYATSAIYAIPVQGPILFGVLVLFPGPSMFPWVLSAGLGLVLLGSLFALKLVRKPLW